MISPFDENVTKMNPTEFELFVKSLLESANEKLQDLNIIHDEKINNHDGTYQIDVTARFKAFGVDFLLLIECKHHKNPIKREIVQTLHDKVRTLGAQKGMIFSTIGFQKGAIQYASQHSIALVRVANGSTSYATRSFDNFHKPPSYTDIPNYIGWLIENKENDSVGMSSLSNDRIDNLIKFLKE